MTGDFEFDPEKDRRNLERHGVRLDWARRLWERTHLIVPAKRIAGENRSLILARVEGKCWAAVFSRRGKTVRLISCHRADRRLERIYEERV